MTLEGVERALELVDLGEVQNAYSVLDRTHEDIVGFCREREIAFVPFFPLGSAFTGGLQKLAGDPAVSSVANSIESFRPRSRWRRCWPAMTGCC